MTLAKTKVIYQEKEISVQEAAELLGVRPHNLSKRLIGLFNDKITYIFLQDLQQMSAAFRPDLKKMYILPEPDTEQTRQRRETYARELAASGRLTRPAKKQQDAFAHAKSFFEKLNTKVHTARDLAALGLDRASPSFVMPIEPDPNQDPDEGEHL